MTRTTDPGATQVRPQTTSSTTPDGFELDVALLEVSDTASLTNLTDDGCGETCGACTTNVA
ncbi:FxLD family lanthipeptide [Streptomyces litchfieldiae]|uniref:FxLD family lanthipeptide n=1 Tax=Streptomyces litchfieldiae TaxID=3075543 RepID=A0ABU2MMB7_9ACTN|nr:FxLD family lanthipeptide [Streptomyces sp. DSM 44938]MDT0342700.1 FxLD family lanthipeptide [Streptomyces sp. DSM 44938]